MASPAPPPPFVYIDAAALHEFLPFPSLISHLRAGLPAFSEDIHCPHRVSFPLPTSPSAALLLMPSWCAHPSLPYLALKAVTSFPSNSPRLPSVHAAVSLFSSATGAPLASLDGSVLTLLRTAAVSVDSMDEAVSVADVVSCATGSQEPIVRGGLLRPGAHLDLVGSFTPAMRECDDEALQRGRVFIDFEAAMDEAGELVGAVKRGVLQREDMAGTLAELAAGTVAGRRSDDEITVFKSVGTAVVDLLAAQLAYENYIATKNT